MGFREVSPLWGDDGPAWGSEALVPGSRLDRSEPSVGALGVALQLLRALWIRPHFCDLIISLCLLNFRVRPYLYLYHLSLCALNRACLAAFVCPLGCFVPL